MNKLMLNPEYNLVDKLSDLFRTGIPELDADLDQLDAALSMPVEKKKRCVYVIGFTDGTSKVGISQNPEQRISMIEKNSGRTIAEFRISEPYPTNIAFEIELLMKQVLSRYCLEGEFFNIPFKKSVSLLEHYSVEVGSSKI